MLIIIIIIIRIIIIIIRIIIIIINKIILIKPMCASSLIIWLKNYNIDKY